MTNTVTPSVNDDRLMQNLAQLSALLLARCTSISKAEDIGAYQHVADLVATGAARVQIRIDVGPETAASVWLLGADDAPIAILGTIVARTALPN